MKWNFLYQITAASGTHDRGLPPPDPRSVWPLSSTEFVEHPPPSNKIPGYATGPHETAWLALGGFSSNLILEYFFRKSVENIQFHQNRNRIKGTLHEDQYIFLIISHLFLPIMGNVSENFIEKLKAPNLGSVFFPPESSVFYEIMGKVW